MLITKDKILKDIKKRIVATTIFTLGMFLPLLLPILTVDLSMDNLIISELVIFVIFTLPFGCILGLRTVISNVNIFCAIKNNKFVIVEDIITGVYLGQQYARRWPSYVGQISLKKYLKRRVQIELRYENLKEGEKCILIFTDISKDFVAFYPGNSYNLDSVLQGQIIDVDRIVNENKKYNNRNKIQEETKILTKKQLLKDCVNKSQKVTVLVFTLLIFVLLFMMIIFRENLLFIVLYGLAVIFLLIFNILKINYLFQIKKNIKNNNYKLVKDLVVEKNFSKSYDLEYLKFQKQKNNHYYYPDELLFSDAKVGDVFYMLYVSGESEPLQIYSEKNIILSEEISDCIK